MIAYPPIDELTKEAGDKYSLCCVIAKRAKELNSMPDQPQYFKPISYAASEFHDGLTKISKSK